MAPGNGTGVVKQGSVQAAKERLQAAQRTSGQSIPPQRPLRPTHAPPAFDRTQPTPSQPTQQQPLTHLPRRNPNLGPPPSARRGPSSYYNIPTSHVAPIAEESESRKSHGSFASSNVIPSIIGAPPGYTLHEGDDDSPSDEEATNGTDDEKSLAGMEKEDREGLVRNASLGKRHKPALTTIRSHDDLRQDKPPTPPEIPRSRLAGSAAGSGRTSYDTAREKAASPATASLRSGTGLLDPSSPSSSASSLSEKDFEKAMAGGMLAGSKAPSVPASSRSPLVPTEQTSNGREHEAAPDQKTSSKLKTPPQSHLADRVGTKRPPRINVDAVKEAEARGSLSSLPELIRRATRLAANLDRGRTVSKLGMDWFGNDSVEKHAIFKTDGRQRHDSMSDMLAAFPPPGLASQDGTPRSHSPSKRSHSQSAPQRQHDASPHRPRGRRCCGMPLWAFLILVIIVLFLVVVAVVVPIVLVVLPRRHPSTSAASSALAACQSRALCANGGTSILAADGSCGCMCANGFTGARCTAASDAGCTTTDIADARNATVGSAIPRLLEGAMARFSVPLNASALLALFSSTGVSCSTENALVTFNGLAARSLGERPAQPLPDDDDDDDDDDDAALSPTLAHDKGRRQAADTPSSTAPAPGAAVTSNGIIYAAAQPSAAPRPAATPVPSSAAAPPSANATALDFARTGVLFVLQEARGLDAAVVAQERLQAFFAGPGASVGAGAEARNVSLGSGFAVDLVRLTVTLANGTVFGGGWNGSVGSGKGAVGGG